MLTYKTWEVNELKSACQ